MVQTMPAESGGKSWLKEISLVSRPASDARPDKIPPKGGGILFDHDIEKRIWQRREGASAAQHRDPGDFPQAFIGLMGTGYDLRTSHARRPAFLPEPAAVGPNVTGGKVVDHFGEQFCNPHRELTLHAVEMCAFLFFATRG